MLICTCICIYRYACTFAICVFCIIVKYKVHIHMYATCTCVYVYTHTHTTVELVLSGDILSMVGVGTVAVQRHDTAFTPQEGSRTGRGPFRAYLDLRSAKTMAQMPFNLG